MMEQSKSRRKLIIIGAGGHAKVVLAALRARGELSYVDFLLDDFRRGTLMDKVIAGPISEIRRIPVNKYEFHVAIGDNAQRARIMKELEELGARFRTISHPSAVIETDQIGPGCFIAANSFVGIDAELGKGVIVNTSASVDHDCYVGDYSHVAPGSRLGGGVRVGEGTLIGIGTSVVPNVRVGNWSLIGAGSVIIKDIPDRVKAYGVPATVRENL